MSDISQRHIIPISGKDSLATAIVQRVRDQNDYEYIYSITGEELPETMVWLNKIEKELDIKIYYIGEKLIDIIKNNNWYLPSRQQRYCTRLSKIIPMEKYIGKDSAYVYYGLRADEDRVGYNNSKPNILPCYPLKELGINLDLFMPTPKDYFRQYAIRTGSALYSQTIIARGWLNLGWVGTEEGLRRIEDCQRVVDGSGKSKWKIININGIHPPIWNSEEEFFEWINVKWTEPSHRNNEVKNG